MTGDKNYPYLDKSSLKEKINYSYSKFEGQKFLIKYKTSRNNLFEKASPIVFELNNPKTESAKLFLSWISEVEIVGLDLLIKRFEVTKKIYAAYDQNLRPYPKNITYEKYESYICFSYLLADKYNKTRKLQYLNSLLKVNDILIGNYKKLSQSEQNSLRYCLTQELFFINEKYEI